MDRFVKECFVTKIYRYEALEIWEQIKIGQELSLTENKEEDKEEILLTISSKEFEYRTAFNDIIRINSKTETGDVMISLKCVSQKENNKEYKIGTLNKDDSKSIIDIISCGYQDIFSARIVSKDDKNEENKRIKVVIYIKEKN